MPSLWANFGIMLSGSPGRFGALRTTSGDLVNLTLVTRWWQRFLDRSRNADLSIVIGSWANTGYSCSARDYRIICSILDETLKHRSRLVRLQICTLFFPPSDCVYKTLDLKDMAKIKWLKVVGSHNVTVYVDKKSMPNLTTLDYDGAVQFPLQIQTLPTQLLTLSVLSSQANNSFSWQWTFFKNILFFSPLLRKLECCFLPFRQSVPPSMTGVFTLQTVQEVCLKFVNALPGLAHRILDHFEFPTLDRLEIELDGGSPHAWVGIDAFLLRSQAPLSTLILAHDEFSSTAAKSSRDNDDCILNILQAAPHLENLILRRVDIGDYLRGVLDLEDMSVRQRLDVLPKLRSVEITPRVC
ncbi:hypothetical protein DFH11DRAFT_1616973 [Phellopilus nigrolimitatus]|nr:hypothetical protein DFH11DRAFT_1616973 [Phellopilus nigrolimitatus]